MFDDKELGEESYIVHQEVLKSTMTKNDNKSFKTYEIDGELFMDEESDNATGGEYVEYELYMEKNEETSNIENAETYCSKSSDFRKYKESSNELLEFSILKKGLDVIINSNVYLTCHQWHTLIPMDDEKFRCIVCDLIINDLVHQHIKSYFHMNNLNMYKPLGKYDLSIVRRIRNIYHCAVCNNIFESLEEKEEHLASKNHENNLLFAINKVTDVIDDDSQLRYDDNNLNDKNNDPDAAYANIAKKRAVPKYLNIELGSKSLKIEFDSYHESQNEDSESIDDDNEFNDNDYNDDENNHGISYAGIAKIKALPKFLNIDLGIKNVRIKFDSYHMFKNMKSEFYCMACKGKYHLRIKPSHSIDDIHLDRLRNCELIPSFGDYFIRRVDHRLYHCGHCNNLQLHYTMQGHLETSHPKSNKLKIAEPIFQSTAIDAATRTDTPPKNVDTALKNFAEKNYTQLINFDTALYDTQENWSSTDIYNTDKEIILYQFGYKISVPFLYYNVVSKVADYYFCGLCNIMCDTEEMPIHIRGCQHLEFLQTSPYIRIFKTNLIRSLNLGLHCTICNSFINPGIIGQHNLSVEHKNGISKALRFASPRQNLGEEVASDSITNDLMNNNNKPFNHNPLSNVDANSNINSSKVPIARYDLKGCNTAEIDTIGSIWDDTPSDKVSSPVKRVFTKSNKVDIRNKPIVGLPNTVNGNKINEITSNVTKTDEDNQTFTGCMPTLDTGIRVNTGNKPISGFHYKVNTNKINEIASDISNVEAKFLNNNDRSSVDELKNIYTPTNYQFDNYIYTPTVSSYTDEDRNTEIDNQSEFSMESDKKSVDRKVALNEANNKSDCDLEDKDMFDFEEYVHLILNKRCFRVTNAAYNSLVHNGDGSRFCFICSEYVFYDNLKKHVERKDHINNVKKSLFVENYEEHLLRQYYLTFHCTICNVLLTRQQIKLHLKWPPHLQLQKASKKHVKKLKHDLKNDTLKKISVKTRSEIMNYKVKEPELKILLKAIIEKRDILTKKFLVKVRDSIFKIDFFNWHGLVKRTCLICRSNDIAIDEHLAEDSHIENLKQPFEMEYLPDLLRKVNETTLHCIFCNVEIMNKHNLINKHIRGKKHLKISKAVKTNSNDNSDCHDDIINI